MDAYIVVKVVSVEDIYTTIVVRPVAYKKGAGLCVTGNLPAVFNGLCIEIALNKERSFVEDYRIQLTERNVKILKNHHVDVDKYTDALNLHAKIKGYKFGWSIAEKDVSEIYQLLSFEQADKLHHELVNNASDEKRISFIAKSIRETARNKKKVSYTLEEYISLFDSIEQRGDYPAVSIGEKAASVLDEGFNLAEGIVYDKEIHEMEEEIAENINMRKKESHDLLEPYEIQEFEDTLDTRYLAREQIDIIPCLQTSEPVVVTGGAGVGKTTVIKTLIDCYAMHYNKENVLLIAPTGKASRRLAEKTKLAASTIHRALRKSPDDNFIYYNKDRNLPHRLIIVDESSMVDTSLMYDLLNAVEPTAKIVFVGDHNQLRPVGYGEPFFDFMGGEDERMRLQVFRLQENHRQDGDTDILKAADDALNGKRLHSGKGVKVRDITYEEISGLLTADDKTQIISPYHILNDEINRFMHKGESPISVGDKIMTIRNAEDYCNGDIGYVKQFAEEGAILSIDNKDIVVPYDKMKDVVLAYAITVHKMQGSEADRVKVFIPRNDWRTDSRMMYTAVTRARKELEVYYYQPPVGSLVLSKAC